jgi:hypothetical protein
MIVIYIHSLWIKTVLFKLMRDDWVYILILWTIVVIIWICIVLNYNVYFIKIINFTLYLRTLYFYSFRTVYTVTNVIYKRRNNNNNNHLYIACFWIKNSNFGRFVFQICHTKKERKTHKDRWQTCIMQL